MIKRQRNWSVSSKKNNQEEKCSIIENTYFISYVSNSISFDNPIYILIIKKVEILKINGIKINYSTNYKPYNWHCHIIKSIYHLSTNLRYLFQQTLQIVSLTIYCYWNNMKSNIPLYLLKTTNWCSTRKPSDTWHLHIVGLGETWTPFNPFSFQLFCDPRWVEIFSCCK